MIPYIEFINELCIKYTTKNIGELAVILIVLIPMFLLIKYERNNH